MNEKTTEEFMEMLGDNVARIKACSECYWFLEGIPVECSHPMALRNPVTGIRACRDERTMLGRCGPVGRLWEKREKRTLPERLREAWRALR